MVSHMSMSLATYRIETPRLIIRAWSPEDAPQMRRAEEESKAHLSTFMVWAKKIPQTMDEVVDKIRSWRIQMDSDRDCMYGVFDRQTNAIVGGSGLHPRSGVGGIEIGYWVHSAWTNKGIATEVAGALTRVAIEVGDVRFVEIRCAKSNTFSARVAQRLGYVHEATLRQRIEMPNDVYADALVFSMFEADYGPSPAKKTEITAAFDIAGRRLM